MRTITTVVIGAGHAGLAMSRCLAERGDRPRRARARRGRQLVADRALGLAPAAHAQLAEPAARLRLRGRRSRRLPDDARGRSRSSTATRSAIAAPVQTHTRVTSVRRTDAGYLVRTDRGDWHAGRVVLATGACNIPCVPRLAEARAAGDPDAHADGTTATPISSSDGGVLVVGASATGIQLADEIHRSGRPVTLAVGEHIRAPRTYRGRDIQWWMDAAGVLDQRYDEVDDIDRARKVPSLQLVGSPERTHARSQRAWRAAASGWSAGSPASATAGCSSRARSPTSARCPTSRWAGCSTPSTAGRARTASTARSSRRTASPRPEVDDVAAAQPRSRPRRHPDDHLGDRLSPRLLLARGAGARPQGPAPPRRRGRRRRPACM